jgi:hypothetical protein
MTTASPHECSFPIQPPDGSFLAPGPCECGKTFGSDHGRTVYEAHHAVMHEQVGRRGSHHKAYEDLTPKVRARYVAAGQAVAGPLEAEIERLSALVADPPPQALDIAWNALQHLALHADDKSAAKARETLRAINEFLEDGTTGDGVDRTPRTAPDPLIAIAIDASDLEVAAIVAERNQLRLALRQLADDGNGEARDRLAGIFPELTGAVAQPPAPDPAAEIRRLRAVLGALANPEPMADAFRVGVAKRALEGPPAAAETIAEGKRP